jgi:hypothetical protein
MECSEKTLMNLKTKRVVFNFEIVHYIFVVGPSFLSDLGQSRESEKTSIKKKSKSKKKQEINIHTSFCIKCSALKPSLIL